MEFLSSPTRVLFFTGKGGVGKTSVACAAAVRLADAGKRVLLISTDPASNLDEVLGTTLAGVPTAVPGVPLLSALNIDPEASAREYRERMVGPYRGILPDAAVASMEEQFSGSCTLEIAAFDEFARLLGGTNTTTDFDHVLFDTAPTGHTLRLLSLPSAWDGFLRSNTTGASCLGPLAGLQAQQKLYAQTVHALGDAQTTTLISTDPASNLDEVLGTTLAGLQAQQKLYAQTVHALGDAQTTTLILVARPDAAALREADRTSGELADLGIRNQRLVINGLFRATDPTDPVARAMESRGADALAAIPSSLAQLPRTMIPLAPAGLVGVEAVRTLGRAGPMTALPTEIKAPDLLALDSLIDALAAPGHGVILTMGKGGVGKTTIAAAVAVALADRGFRVQLSTTDPAAHVAATLNGDVANLSVSRIDPKAETAAYSAEVLATAGKGLDDAGRAMLEEDLRSPCTEEIAVFRAFAEAVARGGEGFVVLDTAPTGHTILLLDSALAYHREVTRQSSGMPEAVEKLLPRLRDATQTRVLIVALPEATPVHEAAKLQADLTRAGIPPFAWVMNQCLTPLTVTDPVLVSRRAHEARYLKEVAEVYASRVAMIPWQVEPPVGPECLRQLSQHDDVEKVQS